MSFISLIYTQVFYRPILNGLLVLTTFLPGHDLGLAVILLTVLIKILTFPMTHKMLRTQKIMKEIEPQIKKINEEKKDKNEQARALMELYKIHGINPFSGFFMLIIQLPILFAMYRVFINGIPFKAQEVYYFLSIPENINLVFLGFISLTEASIGLAAIAAISQFLQIRLATVQPAGDVKKKADMAVMMQKQMMYVFPVMIFFLGFKLPAAVSLYWTSMNIFAIIHEAMVRRKV
ncbi:membrane protein insertase YidC [Candidatus Giovannonibacteria bacterium]|nr:membrane protein insertase YidC [Candidatus Giovannonibacteria bacterium]